MQSSPKPSGRRGQRWLWLGYGVCLALGIPWYRRAGTLDPRWLGMPLWGWVTLVSCVAMSLLTVVAVVWVWPEDAESVATSAVAPDEGLDG